MANLNFSAKCRVIPELESFLAKTIPSIGTIPPPATVDEAIVANGKAAANINNILAEFSGLPLLELLLRVGQYNEVLQGILAASLEYIEGSDRSLLIVSPTSDGAYTDDQEIQFSCDTPGDMQPNQVMVACYLEGDSVGSFSLDNLAPDYPESWMLNQQLSIAPFGAGSYKQVDVHFSASYDDGASGNASVSIQVEGSQSGGE